MSTRSHDDRRMKAVYVMLAREKGRPVGHLGLLEDAYLSLLSGETVTETFQDCGDYRAGDLLYVKGMQFDLRTVDWVRFDPLDLGDVLARIVSAEISSDGKGNVFSLVSIGVLPEQEERAKGLMTERAVAKAREEEESRYLLKLEKEKFHALLAGERVMGHWGDRYQHLRPGDAVQIIGGELSFNGSIPEYIEEGRIKASIVEVRAPGALTLEVHPSDRERAASDHEEKARRQAEAKKEEERRQKEFAERAAAEKRAQAEAEAQARLQAEAHRRERETAEKEHRRIEEQRARIRARNNVLKAIVAMLIIGMVGAVIVAAHKETERERRRAEEAEVNRRAVEEAKAAESQRQLASPPERPSMPEKKGTRRKKLPHASESSKSTGAPPRTPGHENDQNFKVFRNTDMPNGASSNPPEGFHLLPH